MSRHRTAEEKVALGERARALRSQGRSRREIAAELHVGDDLLSELLQGTEVPVSLRRRKAKDDHREAAVALRLAGRTYDEIADELGVSKGSLSLWLRDLPHPTADERAHPGGNGPSDVEPQQLSLVLDDHPADRRSTARQMRIDGYLLREIAEAAGVSLKTACLWCRGLPVPPRARHGGDRAHVRMMNRKRWDAFLVDREAQRAGIKSHAAAEIGAISARELDLVAVTAYWCEGSKDKPYARRERVIFINSDAGLIQVWLEFLLRRGYGVDRLRLSLSIHESADVQAATEYWAAIVGVDATYFQKPTLKKHNPKTVRKNVGDAYVGCLVVRVLQGRQLYQEIEGIWRGIVSGARPDLATVAS